MVNAKRKLTAVDGEKKPKRSLGPVRNSALELLGFGALVVAGWMVAVPLGLLVLGLGLIAAGNAKP